MDLLLSIYYKLPKYENKSLVYKIFIRVVARIIKLFLDNFFTFFIKSQVKLTPKNEGNNNFIIASMTSFPSRINYVHISIECILRQSLQPNKIILWLAESQFPNKLNDLPPTIIKQMARGLEINFCDDLRSHKKYYFSLMKFPESKVIMLDDDLYYHKDLIKNLVYFHDKNPNYIIASRVHKMVFKNNSLVPYRNWIHNFQAKKPSLYLHHTSGNGTLIPNKVFFDEVTLNPELMMDLSPNSDDVWLKMNLIRQKREVFVFNKYNRDPITVKSTHSSSLVSKNTFKGFKDLQIEKTVEYFKINFDFKMQ